MPQQQQVNLKIKGLYTAPNDFSGVPDGALEIADDVYIDYENLAEPRRGFNLITQAIGSAGDRVDRFVNYQGIQVVHYGVNKLAYYSAGWNTYTGTFDHPDSNLARVRFCQANSNLYISTATGVKKLDVYTGTPAAAGVPKGLDLQTALTGSSGFLGTNQTAATAGSTTITSPSLTLLTSLSGITVGNFVFGTGIPSNTTVSSVTQSTTVLTTTGTTVAGSNQLTALPVNTGIVAGQLISGLGILTGTRVSSITGGGPYTVTMSQNAFQANTAANFTFSSDPIVTMSQNATATNTAVAITFSAGAQVAYRGLFGIRDANNNVLYGTPSQFSAVANNTGTTSNTTLTMTIPTGITTAHFYQFYRSSQTASSSISPTDDEQLVFEGNPTSTDITNGFVTITDSTPDSLRGLSLYTGVSQDGIAQQNEPPPYCKDFCAFKGFGIYANVRSKQRKKLTMLAVGAPNGVQVGDTLTIGGVVYTAAGTENTTTGNFLLTTTGTPAQNIANTVNSLIKVINRYASNSICYAFLLSGPTDLPGQIQLEEKGVGGSSYSITVSARGTAYSPTLPTSGTTVSSTQDIYKNGILISKSGQFEAVPSINLLFAGDAAKEILRVIPLREYVVILKQDGIFRMTGSTLSTLTITPFDLTTKLLAPDSAVSLSNQVWGLFDQGVCSVSDTGVNVKSRPIETNIRTLVSSALSTIRQISFAVGYETDRKYILGLPGAAGDTACQFEYVFNLFTNAWTRWTRVATGGYIDDADLLYLGNGNANTVSVERKSNTYTDYVDEGFAVNITASLVYQVTLTTVTGINVGDILYLNTSTASVITAIDAVNQILTVQDKLVWTNGAATVLPAIKSVIQWKPLVAGNPAFQRQYSEGIIIFKNTRFYNALISFYSDLSLSQEDTPISGFGTTTWGNFPFGTQPWGGTNKPRSIRFLVPQNKQVCAQLSPILTIRSGYSAWKCEGLSVSYNSISQEAT